MRLLILAVLTLCFVGCSGGPDDAPETIPVSGTVTLDGAPLSDARVTFVPDGAGQAASGPTDSSGKFTLTTNGLTGAPAGKYKVSVSSSAPEPMPGVDDAAENAQAAIPAKYSNAAESGLTADVPVGGDNEFTFELSSK